MARTANVFARVEPEVKERAEQVLDRLGIPMLSIIRWRNVISLLKFIS